MLYPATYVWNRFTFNVLLSLGNIQKSQGNRYHCLWSPVCLVRLQHEVAFAPQQLWQEFCRQIFGQNGMCPKSADVNLFHNFSDSHKTVPHHHSIDFGNDLVISTCWRPAESWLVFHRCSAIFKPVVPLLNLCDTHCIVTESRLNLPNGFHLTIAEFLVNFDALALKIGS